jgi:hypothetical protein
MLGALFIAKRDKDYQTEGHDINITLNSVDVVRQRRRTPAIRGMRRREEPGHLAKSHRTKEMNNQSTGNRCVCV